MHQSFQFEDLHKMTDIELKAVFHHVTAPIVGIAIRNVSVEFQKRVLSLSPRTYAEDAYEYMTRRMSKKIAFTMYRKSTVRLGNLEK